uniref:Uncharacterized protein n=1 Tax=Anguilla anguilla TaxID=7936 RepID=A0A0E9VXZ5_ANGAN
MSPITLQSYIGHFNCL